MTTELCTVNCGSFLIQHELFLRFMPRVFRKIYHNFAAPYALICKTGDHSFISQIIIYYLTINRYQLFAGEPTTFFISSQIEL